MALLFLVLFSSHKRDLLQNSETIFSQMVEQKKIAGNSAIKWISGTFKSGETFTIFIAKSEKRRVETRMAPLPHAQHEERPPTLEQ